jgi:hypothetical protein
LVGPVHPYDKTTCDVYVPPCMKMGSALRHAVSFLFSVGVELFS